jgi:hypothetical protein
MIVESTKVENIHQSPAFAKPVLGAVKCLDIEIAIMSEFNIRQNLIVPNISNQMCLVPFETDMLVLKPSGVAYGFEIKTSLSDLKADFKKPQHTKIYVNDYGVKMNFDKYFGKFRHFYFAVPEKLKKQALELLPEHIGLYVLDIQQSEEGKIKRFYCAKESPILSKYKWSEKEKYEVARLGTMRILGLKVALSNCT